MDRGLDFLVTFVGAVWSLTAEMAPWLLLGFLIAGLLSVYVSPGWLERHLGGRGMGPGWKAALLGVPLPLCSCGVIPVAASLRRHGASPAATTAFLISTPQTGVDSIAVTGALLGPVFAVCRPVVALLTGVLGGGLVQLAGGRQPTLTDPATAAGPPARGRRLRTALRYGFATLPRDIGRALVVGLVLAALISVLVPPGSLGGLLGGGVLPIVVMMAVGIPLYVCATGSVPLAAGFLYAGVSPGAVLAFLIAGPATNAATVTTLLRVLGRRTTLIYLATVAASALGGGLLLDAAAGRVDLRLPLAHGPHDHGHVTWFGHAAAALLVVVLAWALRPRRATAAAGAAAAACDCDSGIGPAEPAAAGEQRLELAIDGMRCSHCSASVERALREQPGVRSVTVSIAARRALIEGRNLDPTALAAVVCGLGYAARRV